MQLSCKKDQVRLAQALASRDLQAGLSGPLCLYRFRKALEFTEGAGGFVSRVPFRDSSRGGSVRGERGKLS